MGKKRKTYWYIYTKNDAYTNEVIGKDPDMQGSPENINNMLMCSDRKQRQLWECKWSFVDKMRKNKDKMNLSIVIYRKQGKNGQISKFTFF